MPADFTNVKAYSGFKSDVPEVRNQLFKVVLQWKKDRSGSQIVTLTEIQEMVNNMILTLTKKSYQQETDNIT
jgi:hypothetical protein